MADKSRNDATLAGLRIAILATDGFEQDELTEPRKALSELAERSAVCG